MADEAATPTPTTLYLSAVPTSNGNISGQSLAPAPAPQSLYQLQVNPNNPHEGVLLPAPGADALLAAHLDAVLAPAYRLTGLPKPGQEFIDVEQPTRVERIGENWKIATMGSAKFSGEEKPALHFYGEAASPAREQAALTAGAPGPAQETALAAGANPASADREEPAYRADLGPIARPAANADEPGGPSLASAGEKPGPGPAPEPLAPTGPGKRAAPGPEPVGELRIEWRQQGDEVAPLLEMRAYLDQLKVAGVAVGALRLERGEGGKLTGGFGVSYDPESNKLGFLEATLQGLKQVGHGVEVVEKPGQSAARRLEVGYDDDYEPLRSKQVKEAFGAKQWDALSANLGDVPKTALTAPELVQQGAGVRRVEQLAQQGGRTKEQVLRDGKSLFDIDTSGDPASVFLKNFYAHLTGNPKTRQTLEVDYDKTRRELQARLLMKAGSAPLDQGDEQVNQAPQGLISTNSPALAAVTSAAAPRAAVAPELVDRAPAPTRFQAADVPQPVLASLGLSFADLAQNGQLQRLLSGQKTDLLPMQVAAEQGQEPVRFAGKMVLCREADGTATLKMELPQEKLVIPNEIGGQPFTAEQRQQLATEGNAGLIRGLKDEQGREYNGYVAVDKTMNKLVILPENRVTLHDTVAGVKLTEEQRHDLQQGKAVNLSNMASGDGSRRFDGTAQVNAAKACIEIRPAAHELKQQQPAPGPRQATAQEVPAVRRGPRL